MYYLPMGYMTPAEVAEILKIQEDDVMVLINEGKLRAIKVGPYIRIRETELDELEATCPAGPPPTRPHENVPDPELPSGSRWVTMRSGRARVRVSGSVAAGADMWPGKMRYPIRMPKAFMDALLKRFAGQEVPVGGKFDDPGIGSLGHFIQQTLKMKMNPAVYLAALLIEEGYAISGRRGCVRFLDRPLENLDQAPRVRINPSPPAPTIADSISIRDLPGSRVRGKDLGRTPMRRPESQ